MVYILNLQNKVYKLAIIGLNIVNSTYLPLINA